MKKITFSIFIIFILLFSSMALADTGLSLLSISLDNPPNTPADISKSTYIITMNFVGTSQIVGAIEPDDVKSLSKGWESEFPLTIQGEAFKELFLYPLSSSRTDIVAYKVTIVEGTPKNFGGWRVDDCPEGFTDYEIPVYDDTWYGKYNLAGWVCVGKDIVGKKSEINKETQKFEAKVSVTNGKSSPDVKIISNEIQAVKFDKSPVIMSWKGNLITGNPTPDNNKYVAVLKEGNNRWHTQLRTAWSGEGEGNSYVDSNNILRVKMASLREVMLAFEGQQQNINYEAKYPEECRSVAGDDFDEIIECISEKTVKSKILGLTNSLANKLVSQEVKLSSGVSEDSATSFDTNEEAFVVERTGKFSSKPVVTFEVNGAWIGVKIPKGKPEVVDVTDPEEFESGDSSQVYVKVKNIGTGKDIFTLGSTGCKNIVSKFVDTGVNIEPGQTKTLSMTIRSSGANVDADQDCKGRATAKNSGLYDAFDFHVTMTKESECKPDGIVKVFGEDIYVCDGGKYVLKENCKSVSYKDGKPFCTKFDDGDNGDGDDKKEFKVDIPLIFGILAGFTFFSMQLIKYFDKKNPGYIVFGLAFGGMLGVLTYFIMLNLVKVLAGLAFFGIGGGVLLYIVGGSIVLMAGMFGAIFGAFRSGKRTGKFGGYRQE